MADDVHDRKKAFLARKKLNSEQRYLSIRTRLSSVCKSPEMLTLLNSATTELSRASTAAMRILLIHVQHMTQQNLPVSITQTMVKRCIDIVGGVASMSAKEPKLSAIADLHWKTHLGPDYKTPDIMLLGANAKQYIAKEFLTNIKNHVSLDFAHRHERYVTSIVGRWCDEDKNTTPTDRRRAIRTVQCASLVKTHDLSIIREQVIKKRNQFAGCDKAKEKAKKKASGNQTTTAGRKR